MSASKYSARARLMRAFWPPLMLTPLSPTRVESPSGKMSRSWKIQFLGFFIAHVSTYGLFSQMHDSWFFCTVYIMWPKMDDLWSKKNDIFVKFTSCNKKHECWNIKTTSLQDLHHVIKNGCWNLSPCKIIILYQTIQSINLLAHNDAIRQNRSWVNIISGIRLASPDYIMF